jgi:GMP synthase (glutamine-hydrolysing)
LIVLRAGDAAAPVAARRGEFFSWIRREAWNWDGAWYEHDVRDLDVALPEPSDAAGFVVTGSSASVTERALWMLRTEDLLRRIVDARTPLFGICFGHQMIAEALGGKVAKNPRGREIGTVEVRVKEGALQDPLFDGLGQRFAANATHVDTVIALPPGAHVLAETDLEPHAVYTLGETTKCVQFHPEIDGDAMRGYVDARATLVSAEGLDPQAIFARAVDTPDAAATLRNFVRLVVPRGVTAKGQESSRRQDALAGRQ